MEKQRTYRVPISCKSLFIKCLKVFNIQKASRQTWFVGKCPKTYSYDRLLDWFLPMKLIFWKKSRSFLHEPSGSSWWAVRALLYVKICFDDHLMSISCYVDLNLGSLVQRNLEYLQGPLGCSWRATSAWLDVHQWVFSIFANVNLQFQDFLINLYW